MSIELVAATAELAVATASSSVSVPLPASLTTWSHDLSIVNTGSATAYVAIGATATVPTSSTPGGYPVLAGMSVTLHAPTAGISKVAAIGTAATTLYITACIVAD